MSRPRCPNCREALSNAERGLGGVWSCLYCEAVWLTPEQTSPIPLVHSQDALSVSSGMCPCGSLNFRLITLNTCKAAQCTQCLGLLLPPNALQSVAPNLIEPVLNGESKAEQIAKGAMADVLVGSAIAALASLFC
jgi:hypothetical protein